jgi:hypothetical protein
MATLSDDTPVEAAMMNGHAKHFFVWAIAFILVAAYGLATGALSATPRCGTERWDVKTLADAAASLINFTPVASTVDALNAVAVPGAPQLHTPRWNVERQAYTIKGTLGGYKYEADRDFHVVVKGAAATMIVEFPDPGCTGALKHAEMAKARADFVTLFGQPGPRFHRVPGHQTITVTGVLFFDLLHGQTGVAKNGAELHPVLAVTR